MAYPRHRILREHQQVVLQHVVRLQNIRRSQRDTFDVAARQFQVAVLAMGYQQRRLRMVQLFQHFQKRLGLVRIQFPRIHNRQLLLCQFCRKRRAERTEKHLLRQRVSVIAWLWSVNRAAMTPERRPDRADARAARTLLLPKLAACAADFALFLDFVRACTQSTQVPARSFVQQVLVDFRAKNRVRQLHLTDFLAIQVHYIDDRHNFFSFFSALLRFLGLADKNVRSARPRHRSPHQQQVLVSVYLHDFQVLCGHLDVSHVTWKVLILPNTRRKRTASDATRSAMMHRAVRRIASGIVPALHAALKTLTLAHAAHVHEFASLEVLHEHPVADLRLVLRFLDAHFVQHLHGRNAGLLEVPSHGLVHALRFDEFYEPQLRGLVSVRLLRAALYHYARPRLKDGAPHERAVVDENLRHPQLDSDNSVDRHFPRLSFAACSKVLAASCLF